MAEKKSKTCTGCIREFFCVDRNIFMAGGLCIHYDDAKLISKKYCPDFNDKCYLNKCVCYVRPNPLPFTAYCCKYNINIELEEDK